MTGRLLVSSISLMALLFLVGAGIPGCGKSESLPKIHPVKGKVVYKGGQAVSGGEVRFQLAADPRLITNGEIQKDGSFTLTTNLQGKRAAGAAEGQYQVTVTVSSGGADQLVQEVVLPKPYTVVAGDNDFTIEIAKPRRR